MPDSFTQMCRGLLIPLQLYYLYLLTSDIVMLANLTACIYSHSVVDRWQLTVGRWRTVQEYTWYGRRGV